MMMSIGKECVFFYRSEKCNCSVQHATALVVLSSYIKGPPPLMGTKKKSGGPQEKSSNPSYAQQQKFCNSIDLLSAKNGWKK
jgi:hypothetical protein